MVCSSAILFENTHTKWYIEHTHWNLTESNREKIELFAFFFIRAPGR